jgi:hypothetical protein
MTLRWRRANPAPAGEFIAARNPYCGGGWRRPAFGLDAEQFFVATGQPIGDAGQWFCLDGALMRCSNLASSLMAPRPGLRKQLF